MKKSLKLFILGFVVLCATILLMNSQVLAAEPIVLNGTQTYELKGDVTGPIIIESGDITIKGNGTVTSGSYPDDYEYKRGNESEVYTTIFVKGGNLTIEGGTFISDTGWHESTHAALYVKNDATVTVNAGTFIGKGKDFAVRACAEAATVEGGAAITINGGTFDSEYCTGVADCGGTININGGTWTCDSVYNGQSDILNIWSMNSGKLGSIVVKGGTFVNFDPTKIYKSEGTGSAEVASTANAVAEGYEYDAETGTVACLHDSLKEVKEVPATETSEGKKAHWSCNKCLKLFEDANATKEITDKTSIVIPKLEKVEEDKKEEGKEEGKEEDKKVDVDNTIATGILPQTGLSKYIYIVISLILIVLVIRFIKYKKYNIKY